MKANATAIIGSLVVFLALAAMLYTLGGSSFFGIHRSLQGTVYEMKIESGSYKFYKATNAEGYFSGSPDECEDYARNDAIYACARQGCTGGFPMRYAPQEDSDCNGQNYSCNWNGLRTCTWAGDSTGRFTFSTKVNITQAEFCLYTGPKVGNATLIASICNPCKESWSCTAWSVCNNYTQTRTCTDANKCGTIGFKPATAKACCSPIRTCTEWSACTNSRQTRECRYDISKCPAGTNTSYSTDLTTEEQSCAGSIIPPITPGGGMSKTAIYAVIGFVLLVIFGLLLWRFRK